MEEKKMNVLDLFSGIGGFSLGLERAGMKTVAFCEIDKKAQQVLRKNWPDVPIFEDVSALTKEDIGEEIDVICGGFPCQDISLSGRGAGLAGARSGLWFQFHRLIKEIQPRYAIIENVSALRSRGLEVVLGGLAEIGYDAEWHCIPASAIGAPHQRDRIWIVANPTGGGCKGMFDWDAKSSNAGSSSPFLANTNREWELQQEGGKQNEWGWTCDGSENVANANGAQREGGGVSCGIFSKNSDIGRSSWWEIEPTVGRVAHGVSGQSHRLKQLGNAVVPQIPEIIGKKLMHIESCANGGSTE